jgi:hypothetical protein
LPCLFGQKEGKGKEYVDELYYIILYCTVLYCAVLYCAVLYCTVLYGTVLYCAVLYVTHAKLVVSRSVAAFIQPNLPIFVCMASAFSSDASIAPSSSTKRAEL